MMMILDWLRAPPKERLIGIDSIHLREREREALIDISFKIAHDVSINHSSRVLVLVLIVSESAS